ncbi:MAG: hypothetical protein IJI98_02465 [Methanosphaera sp.]|nr:hypothetical protein [Methanosphaera sp.]
MNKKIIGAIIALIIIVIAGYTFFYAPYQDNVLSEKYNASLQNASNIEKNIVTATEKFNNQNSTDVDVLINTINNEVTPKYSEEIAVLNETVNYANNNQTKINYINNQTKRLELESKSLNATVTMLNAISQYVKGEKSGEDAQSSINRANIEMEDSAKELENINENIKQLLKDNPDLNQTLHGLNLEKPFYGEQRTLQTPNVANNTTSV